MPIQPFELFVFQNTWNSNKDLLLHHKMELERANKVIVYIFIHWKKNTTIK